MNTPAETTADPALEPDMMKVALEADQATSTEPTPQSAAPGETATAPQTKTDAKAVEQASAQPADKATAKPGEGKDGQGKTEATDGKQKADGKPGDESEYTKAKKESERRDRSWKALEEEKAAFRAERGTLQSRLDAAERELQALKRRPAGPAKDANGASASDYERIAARAEKEGNDEMAREARARAEKLRQQDASAAAAPAGGDRSDSPEFKAEWERHVQTLIAEDKTLADPQNPLVKATNTLINDPTWKRFFRAHPDGVRAAYEVAKLMRDANGAKELQTKLTAAEDQAKKDKAEIQRLNGLLQPRGSLPTPPSQGGKKLSDMNEAEADAHIWAVAAAADRGELES